MSFFPVSHSNLSASHLAVYLANKYDFGAEVSCKLIKSGINDTYLVSSGETKYVFRVYSFNWRSPVEIESELQFILELKNAEIPVSYPIPDANGEFLQLLTAPEGLRYGVMFSHAEGNKLHEVSGEIHFEIGRTMAQIHKIAFGQNIARVTYTPEVLLINSMEQIKKFLSADSEEMAYLLKTQKYLIDQLTTSDFQNFSKGIVHMDIWFDNLNITDDGQITIFDFDFCGNGWLSLDIAYYVMQLHNIEKYDAAIYQPKIDEFLKGYESIKAISREEKNMLPVLGLCMYFFYLGVQCQRFENWSNVFLNENYLKRFTNGIIKRYGDIYGLHA